MSLNFKPDEKLNVRQTIQQLKMLATQFLKHKPKEKREEEEKKLLKDKLITGKILSPTIIREVLKKEKEAEANLKEAHFDFVKECIDQAELDLTAGIEPGGKTYLYTMGATPQTPASRGQSPARGPPVPPIPLPKKQDETGKVTYGREGQMGISARPTRSPTRQGFSKQGMAR